MTARRRKAMAHLEMTRPYTVFHSGLIAVAGAEIASAGAAPAWRVVLAAVVTMCGWEAGLYAGDYYDRSIDAVAKPDRPIPSGRVSPREAYLCMLGLILCGYLLALALGPASLLLAVVTTVLGIAYSKTFKARALLGNFDRGILGVCAVLFGSLAGGHFLTPGVALLACLVFCHDSATNLVGAMRDVEGDRAAGCPTVPVVYGMRRAVGIAVALASACLVLGCILLAAIGPSALAVVLFAIAVTIAAAVYGALWISRARVLRGLALGAHKYLVVERLVLSCAFIAAFAPAAVALGLLVAAVAASVGSQAALRDRYEQQRVRYAAAHDGAPSA